MLFLELFLSPDPLFIPAPFTIPILTLFIDLFIDHLIFTTLDLFLFPGHLTTFFLFFLNLALALTPLLSIFLFFFL